MPMTRFPPLLPTASALYLVAVRSGVAAPLADGAAADSAGVDGAAAEAAVVGATDGGFEAVVPHADPMIALAAIRANKRFRM
jgi:hypothetical protein